MSQTIYIIKCIQCKSEFNQGNSYRRICEICVKDRCLKRNQTYKAKKKLQKVLKPDFYEKQCPACDCIFKTKMLNKQFCTERCVRRYKTFPTQLINVENNIIRIERKIEQANIEYEEKIIKLEKKLDSINFELESQRIVYEKKLEFLRSRK